MNVKDKTILITGAGGGLGSVMSSLLADRPALLCGRWCARRRTSPVFQCFLTGERSSVRSCFTENKAVLS